MTEKTCHAVTGYVSNKSDRWMTKCAEILYLASFSWHVAEIFSEKQQKAFQSTRSEDC